MAVRRDKGRSQPPEPKILQMPMPKSQEQLDLISTLEFAHTTVTYGPQSEAAKIVCETIGKEFEVVPILSLCPSSRSIRLYYECQTMLTLTFGPRSKLDIKWFKSGAWHEQHITDIPKDNWSNLGASILDHLKKESIKREYDPS